jgi:hypothetical protein
LTISSHCLDVADCVFEELRDHSMSEGGAAYADGLTSCTVTGTPFVICSVYDSLSMGGGLAPL